MTEIAACRWREPGGRDAAERIAAFLAGIGIALRMGGPDSVRGLLPGLAIERGAVVIDPAEPVWPGDLLHEAGHIAVTEPERRTTLNGVDDDPGEEMAAIAWSVAAARACGVGLDVLFHAGGYRGGSDALATAFSGKGWVGVPMLAWFGMTAEPHRAATSSASPFPEMSRWLR